MHLSNCARLQTITFLILYSVDFVTINEWPGSQVSACLQIPLSKVKESNGMPQWNCALCLRTGVRFSQNGKGESVIKLCFHLAMYILAF